MSEAKEKMKDKEKKYYKIGEVAEMLGVPIYTLRFWEKEFDELEPTRVGNQRRYTPADVEIVKRIMELLYVQKFRIEAAKEAMKGHTVKPQLHAPRKCKSAKGAIRLLAEAAKRIDDYSAKVRVESVLEWLLDTENKTDSQI